MAETTHRRPKPGRQPATPFPEPVPGLRPVPEPIGGTAPRPIDYRELRKMAEAASSIRGRDFWLVIDEKGWRTALEPVPDAGPEVIQIPCKNRQLPERPRVDFAMMATGLSSLDEAAREAEAARLDPTRPPRWVDLLDVFNDKAKGKPATAADAVFWSEAAVEKFLVPYYASVDGDQADRAVEKLLDVFDDGRHGKVGVQQDGDAQPFAIAHIPKSEYVTVGGGTAPTTELLVLSRSRSSGAVTAVPLEEYQGSPKT